MVLDWNGGRETLGAIESVMSSDYPSLRVFLIDNASREPVLEEARRRFPSLHTITNPTNLGYAGGNNVGLRAALAGGAEFVVVLNNDVRVKPGTISELVNVATRGSEIAAVGAKVLRADDPSRLEFAFGEITYRQSLVRLVGKDALDGPPYDQEREVPWVAGCAMLLTRRALERIGLFDEEFFAYHEEVDWCTRAREQRLKVIYAPGAVVVHRGEGSSGGRRYVSRRQYLTARNMVRFARKHGSFPQRSKFTAFLLVTLPLQYLRRLLSGEQAGVALKWRGIRDALVGRPIPRRELGLD